MTGTLSGSTSGGWSEASSGVTEYWYYTGITDSDLVEKLNEGLDQLPLDIQVF